jgi:anti-sigma factor RsiW
MNTHHHDFELSLGPCEAYEFDLIDRSEGALEPGRAEAVDQHLARCSRCRAYAAALAGLDAALAGALPRPQLAADFDARLAARIAELPVRLDRSAAFAAAEREHDRLLRLLGRGVSWRTLLNSLALGSVAGGAVVALFAFAPGMLDAMNLALPGLNPSTTSSILVGIAILLGGAALARRPGGAMLFAD